MRPMPSRRPYSAHAIGHGPSMRPASGATNAKAGPIRNRHGMAVCASGTARPVPTPSVSTRSTAAATKNDARPYTRISYSPRVPQGTDRRGLPHLQQVGRFWNARLQILPSYGRFAPAGPPPHGHRPGRCACTGPWIRRTCRTMDRHPSKYARWPMEPARRKATQPTHPAGHHTVPDPAHRPPPET